MGSILTNTGAMIALQTLRTTQKGLTQTQNSMSTGKKVSDARDNAASWAIGATLQYDVDGFQAIQDNLSSAKAAVDLALTGANSIVDTLKTIRQKLVDAQGSTPDFTKIDNEVTALKAQINNYVNGASYYGVNLLSTSQSVTGLSVVASLNRTSGTAVSATQLTINGQNLTTTAGANVLGVFAGGGASVSAAVDAAVAGTFTNASSVAIAAATASGTTAANTPTAAATVKFDSTTVATGNTYTVQLGIGGTTHIFSYVAQTSDTVTNIADSLRTQINSRLTGSTLTSSTQALASVNSAGTTTPNGTLTVENYTTQSITLNASVLAAGTGLLSSIGSVSASNAANAVTSLTSLDTAFANASAAAAALGTFSNRLGQQSDFVSKMQDSLKSGISALTDADMEATAARLQALQVQQQLGVQALAIANAQPQVLLALFKNG